MVQGPSWESAESEAIESKVSSPVNTSVNVLGIVIFLAKKKKCLGNATCYNPDLKLEDTGNKNCADEG